MLARLHLLLLLLNVALDESHHPCFCPRYASKRVIPIGLLYVPVSAPAVHDDRHINRFRPKFYRFMSLAVRAAFARTKPSSFKSRTSTNRWMNRTGFSASISSSRFHGTKLPCILFSPSIYRRPPPFIRFTPSFFLTLFSLFSHLFSFPFSFETL